MGHQDYVGRPIERTEDLRFLRGKGEYVDDVNAPGQLYAVMLRSSVAHGRIRSIDTSAGRAKPGVHAVITEADLGSVMPVIPMRLAPLPELKRFEQPVIARGKVRYVGEPIAMVVAESAAAAEDAVDAIVVDIEILPPITNRADAAANQSLLFESLGSNHVITYTASKGDAASVGQGEYVRREHFKVQRHMAVPMEPRGWVAVWNAGTGRMRVSGAAKVPFAARRLLAAQLGLPEESVEMIEVDVGGGFGMRGEFYPEDFLVPFAARRLNRPVKWTEDRREHMMTTNHSRELECELEIVCKRDGTILALRGNGWLDAGAYFRTNGSIAPRNVAQFMSGPYRIENIHITIDVFLSNKTPVGTYRGPGRFEADFFRERLLDMAAGDLGIDRVEFRRRNLVLDAEMPYPLAVVTPPEKIEEIDSGDYAFTLDRCLAEFNWREKSALEGKLIDGRYHGIALGCFIEGGGAGPKETARLVVERDALISLYVGSSGIGQGLETVCAQISADALRVPMEKIRVFHGSTTYLKEGFGSFHSRSVVVGGSAIIVTSNNLKEAIKAAAARRWECAVEDVEIRDGLTAFCAGRTLTLEELAKDDINADGEFANHKHTYSYGTHAAHVAVDAKTGQVEVIDYLCVEDVGRIINPLTMHGQVVGSIVQGLGGTFLEHLIYDDNGQLLTASFADYLLPSATDFPNLRAISLEHRPSPNNPLGAKGGGEGGTIPVGGAIANAIANALQSFGVQPRELPLSPAAVWELIEDGKRETGNGKSEA